MVELETVVHVFIMSHAAGETSVFLIEREPGVVEFPTLKLAPVQMDDETGIVGNIERNTGLRVALSGFLSAPVDDPLLPKGSRFLLARHLHGTPCIAGEHVGWEWRPGGSLLSLQFVPKLMADELRSFMNG